MTYKYILVDGYLEIDNEKISFSKRSDDSLKKRNRSNIIITIVFIGSLQYLMKINALHKVKDYIDVFLSALGLLVSAYLIYYLAFKKVWSKKITINTISKIIIKKDDYETEVIIKLLNKREKELNFRTLENQVEPFIEQLKKRNSRIKISHERV